METRIGNISLMFSGVFAVPAWLLDNAIQLGSLFLVGVSTVFACISYYKGWKLKDAQRKEIETRLNEK